MELRNIDIILSDYFAYLQGEKQLAPTTIEGYMSAVRNWYLRADRTPEQMLLPGDWTWTGVDKRSLEIYLRHFREERGWKDDSIRFQASALRSFFQFLRERGHIPRNPARSLMPTRAPKILPVPQGEESAVRKLFAHRGSDLATSRLLAVLELIYGGGLRPAQAYRTTGLHLRPRQPMATVETERGSVEIPISDAGRLRLTRYMALCEEVPMPPGARRPFWCDGQGRALPPATLARHVAKAMEQAGLSGGASTLRILSARHFKERGGDIRSLKRFLGLKRLDALERYAGPDFKEMAEQFRRFHPRGDNPD